MARSSKSFTAPYCDRSAAVRIPVSGLASEGTGKTASPGDRETLAAGSEHAEQAARAEQGVHRLRRHVEHVLAVVQDEQHPAAVKMLHHRVQDRLAGCMDDADGRRDRRRDVGRIGQRAQVDEPQPLRELIEQLAGGLDRQACLADAAGAGEGDERRGGEHALGLCDLPLATNEGRELAGKVVRTGVQRPRRSELSDEARGHDLVETLRGGQILELVLAEVEERDAVRKLVAGEIMRRPREEDLALRGPRT